MSILSLTENRQILYPLVDDNGKQHSINIYSTVYIDKQTGEVLKQVHSVILNWVQGKNAKLLGEFDTYDKAYWSIPIYAKEYPRSDISYRYLIYDSTNRLVEGSHWKVKEGYADKSIAESLAQRCLNLHADARYEIEFSVVRSY